MALNTGADSNCLKVVSHNMHGFNQGRPVIERLIKTVYPDIFLLQEHCLTPANLYKLDLFGHYFLFGCSAMNHIVESNYCLVVRMVVLLF